ncbi:MAG: cytochrome c family protein [Gemmataceae bacterium]|nr:cytochrome c family protein [Gemmataceae bacterium]
MRVALLVVALVVVAVAGAGGVGSARPTQPPARLPASAKSEAPAKPYGVDFADLKGAFATRPSTTCASSSCHGGGHPGDKGSEHSTWAPEASPPANAPADPHAKAYRVLFNPVSVRMGKILKLTPHKDRRCLVCHAVEGGKELEPDAREQILSEGVGCAGCHGPSDKWIAEHYLPGWKARSNQSKWQDFGFVPTKSLVARTLNCAGCHVGDAERDMNHDFIAAGHPRLAFEPARFHHQPDYRKHWAEKGRAKDFEVRLWVVGQVATLRASINLLAERANRADKPDAHTPWPEFSGYSCYSCHQTIGDPELRNALSDSPRPPGLPGWEVWSNTGFDVAANACEQAFPGLSSPKRAEVEKLRSLMASRRSPDMAEVARQAKAAVAELDRWLAEVQSAEERGLEDVAADSPQRIARDLAQNALSKDGKRLADHDWDSLAANYLGVAAMYHAAGGKGGAGATWREPLAALGDSLRFPSLPGARADGPFKFGRLKLDTIRDKFEFLRTGASASEGK